MSEDSAPAECLVFGSRTRYAAEVAEIVWRVGWEIRLLVDNLPDGPVASSLGRVVTPADLTADDLDLPTLVPLLTPGYRALLVEEARSLGLHRFPHVDDPTAVVARSASIRRGSIVNAGVVVGAATSIGEFVHLNRSASVGHDVQVADFASIGPGAVLSGSVRVCTGAFLGAGVVCVPEVTIGADSVIGAGSVVVKDVPSNTVVAGNPARVLRQSIAGYRDVGVTNMAPGRQDTNPQSSLS
jgi:sugar O-acyltransferase (sialic acid O-acetyltransferase NeuD family)